MGRRSINTTKSGKYMNPTDQARKEARKKELKKNKRQRQMVRAAVLKGKDPHQILVDLEKIDQMEYNVLQPSPLNEKVLKDKRKKLKDTLDRVLKMYQKDDQDKFADLKRAQNEYDRRRVSLFNYYEAVKNAQEVQLDEIPLPHGNVPLETKGSFPGLSPAIPIPPQLAHLRVDYPHGILKKNSAYGKDAGKEPAGVPARPPPELEEYIYGIPSNPAVLAAMAAVAPPGQKKSIRFALDDDNIAAMEQPMQMMPPQPMHPPMHQQQILQAPGTEGEPQDGDDVNEDQNLRPTSLQQKMLAMAGQDIDHFMREMEQVNKKRRADRAAELDARLNAMDDLEDDDERRELASSVADKLAGLESASVLAGMPGLSQMMFRPPPRSVPSLMGIRLPPGPPPGLPPRMGMRLPPGPPPGLPPRINICPPQGQQSQHNVLSAAPQLINRPEQTGPTIQAQAQIRNLSADVTRFLPTALRVKRDEKNKPKPRQYMMHEPKVEKIHQPVLRPGQTKDDAYQQFMREMEGLL